MLCHTLKSTLFPYTTLFRSLEAFYDNPNALRDYFRDIGRMVLAAEGRKNHTTNITKIVTDRKSGSAGMPRPISYAVFCLKKKNKTNNCNSHVIAEHSAVDHQ